MNTSTLIHIHTHTFIYIYIYDPGSRFADPPPPMVSPPPTLPQPKLCDCAHEGSKSDNCHEDRVPRRPIRVTVHIFQARLSREGAKAEAINCHEDRVPCDCRHFRKRTPTNKAAVPRTVFPDRPDPCDN